MEKRKFHYAKYPIDVNNIDIDKIMISGMISCGRKGLKYFTAYKDAKEGKALSIMHLKKMRYRKSFDDTNDVLSLIKVGELLKKYNKIWYKVSNSI